MSQHEPPEIPYRERMKLAAKQVAERMKDWTPSKPARTQQHDETPAQDQDSDWVHTVEHSPMDKQRRITPEMMKHALDF